LQLVGSLRLSLTRLRRLDDPRAFVLASQCEALLGTITSELDALEAERRR